MPVEGCGRRKGARVKNVGTDEGGTGAEHSPQDSTKQASAGGGSIFHRDRGSQYTSEEMTKYISRTGLRQSFSGKDIPGGNFRSESFFANLKEGHGPLGPRNIGQRTKEIFFRGLSGM